jgi:hypothetical protein
MNKGLRFLANNIVGFLALFVALGGVGYAASGGFTSNGKLQGCVGGNGTLSVVKPGKKCKKGQTAVAWNQEGPQGAAGAKGATGAPGVTGAAGAAGTPGANGHNGADASSPDIKWASISKDGVILAANGVEAVGGKTTPYAVAFNSDITNCAVLATQNGSILNYVVSDVQKAGAEAFVHIESYASADQAASFSIAAFC